MSWLRHVTRRGHQSSRESEVYPNVVMAVPRPRFELRLYTAKDGDSATIRDAFPPTYDVGRTA